jgi:predicted transcriptional regulator
MIWICNSCYQKLKETSKANLIIEILLSKGKKCNLCKKVTNIAYTANKQEA